MNVNEVAAALLERRLKSNPVIMQGEMQQLLGAEGMSEALRQRWIVPDNETGFLKISGDENIMDSMRSFAATVESKPAPEPEKKPVREARDFAMEHAGVEPRIVHELLAPGTGHDNSAAVPKAPAMPTTPASTSPKKYQIGEDVMVVENGKSYVGKVAKDDNGRYTVSFGDNKPPQPKQYGQEELSPVSQQRP